MSPKPIIENSTTDYDQNASDATIDHRDAREVTAWMRWEPIRNALICLAVIAACIIGVVWAFTGIADARPTQSPEPIAAPQSLLKARHACGNHDTIVTCRSALRRAYAAVEWQRHARLHQGAYGVDHAIRLASALYSVPLVEMRSVSNCESHQHATSKNLHSTASGLFQFLDSTWNRAGIPGFSVFDPYANAIAAARLVTTDGSWREWSCKP